MSILVLVLVMAVLLILAGRLTKEYKSRETPQKDGSWKSGNPPYKNKKSDFAE